MSKNQFHKKSNSSHNQIKTELKPADSGLLINISSNKKIAAFILLGISAIIFLLARLKLLAIPLERDEGSFAYIGHWMWRGRDLYTELLDSKFPGLYLMYGFFTSIFGYNATGIHMGLLFSNLVASICFFVLLNDLYNRLVACIATSFLLIMIMSPNVYGFASHATQLSIPYILASTLLFWKGIRTGKIYIFFLAGLLLGIAFTIKQPAILFGMLLAGLWWPIRLNLTKKDNLKLPYMEWLALGIGGIIPVILTIIYFLAVGRFDEFYKWTIFQPFNLAGAFTIPWYTLLSNVFPKVVDQFEGIWLLAALGLFFIFKTKYKNGAAWFGVLFALLGLLSVNIGAGYYKHYFVFALPGITLLSACTLDWLSNKTGKHGVWISIAIALILIMISLKDRSYYYFNPNYAKIHYQAYDQNMFPESEKIGRELSKRVKKGERLGIMGSEPEVLVAAGRESCSKYLMLYGILIDPDLSPAMQEEYIHEMQECFPKYIVWNTTTSSWARGYDKLAFFEELMKWVKQNYDLVGRAESRKDKPGLIFWDDALITPESPDAWKIYVLKRKNK